jgi:hypothetical protein
MGVAYNVGRVYARREPERDVLYRVLQEHVATFLQGTESDDSAGLPRHVRREFYGYLDCGILARGAARVACATCKDDILVAFSCRGRGFCPSCGARRMSDTAAHLVDRVLPHVPIRQWVLSLPFRVRFLCARDAALLRDVLRIFLREVFRCVRRLLRRAGVRGARCGSVTAIQRFGGNLGLNVHLHALVLDGAFARDASDALVFHELSGLRQADIARVAARTSSRVTALLARRGLGADNAADGGAQAPDLLATLCAASVSERIALGPKAGWRITHVGAGGPHLAPVRVPPSEGTLLAEADGFNVHAGVFVPAYARGALERLCRYILRPPLARDRLTLGKDGRVFWELKRPYDDGTTHLAFEPLVFLERLAALVPPPRSHLVLYHGVLSSHASWRGEILPRFEVAVPAHAHDGHDDRSGSLTTEPPSFATQSSDARSDDDAPDTPEVRARRLRWAQLLQRVFGLDVLKCSRCGGRREVLSFILRPAELKRICAHLGYPTEAPPIAPARAPPQGELWDQPGAG